MVFFIESPKIGTFVVLEFWTLISFLNFFFLDLVMAISYSHKKEFSNGVLHFPIGGRLTPSLMGFMVGSQIRNLIPNLFLLS